MPAPSASMMQGEHVGHVTRPHAHGRPHLQMLPELKGGKTEGDEHHPGQEVLA